MYAADHTNNWYVLLIDNRTDGRVQNLWLAKMLPRRLKVRICKQFSSFKKCSLTVGGRVGNSSNDDI